MAAVARAAGRIPVVGIGGISVDNAPRVLAAGAAGVAVIGAVMRAGEPLRAAAELIQKVRGATAAADSPLDPSDLQ